MWARIKLSDGPVRQAGRLPQTGRATFGSPSFEFGVADFGGRWEHTYVPAYVCSRLFARSYPYVKIDVKAERLPLLTVN